MTDKFAVPPVFLNAVAPLTPRNAMTAIIVKEAGPILLELRVDKEDIFLLNHWGGGAVDGDESPEQALFREFNEELSNCFHGGGCSKTNPY